MASGSRVETCCNDSALNVFGQRDDEQMIGEDVRQTPARGVDFFRGCDQIGCIDEVLVAHGSSPFEGIG